MNKCVGLNKGPIPHQYVPLVKQSNILFCVNFFLLLGDLSLPGQLTPDICFSRTFSGIFYSLYAYFEAL